MKDFLVKLKLIQHFNMQIEADQTNFAEKLGECVDVGGVIGVFRSTNLFSLSKKEYFGEVDRDHFKIRRKRTGYERTGNFAVAKGTFSQHGKNLVIEAEINGLRTMIPYYTLLIIFYPLFLIIMLDSKFPPGKTDFMIPFLIMHAIAMFVSPFFMMKKGVKRLKYDLEREFYFLSEK